MSSSHFGFRNAIGLKNIRVFFKRYQDMNCDVCVYFIKVFETV